MLCWMPPSLSSMAHHWRWPASGVIYPAWFGSKIKSNALTDCSVMNLFTAISHWFSLILLPWLTSQLSLCVIAVDWSGYSSLEHHVLRASLLCDGCSLPLLSWVVPSEKQQNSQIQKNFPDALAEAVNPVARVIIVTDAGVLAPLFPDRGCILS